MTQRHPGSESDIPDRERTWRVELLDATVTLHRGLQEIWTCYSFEIEKEDFSLFRRFVHDRGLGCLFAGITTEDYGDVQLYQTSMIVYTPPAYLAANYLKELLDKRDFSMKDMTAIDKLEHATTRELEWFMRKVTKVALPHLLAADPLR